MTKRLLGFTAFFLYASLGIATSFGDVPQNRDVDVLTFAGEAQEKPNGDHADSLVNAVPIDRLEMSQEEKERRQDECVTLWEACEDWCWKSNKKGEEFRACREDCSRKLGECMGKIP